MPNKHDICYYYSSDSNQYLSTKFICIFFNQKTIFSECVSVCVYSRDHTTMTTMAIFWWKIELRKFFIYSFVLFTDNHCTPIAGRLIITNLLLCFLWCCCLTDKYWRMWLGTKFNPFCLLWCDIMRDHFLLFCSLKENEKGLHSLENIVSLKTKQKKQTSNIYLTLGIQKLSIKVIEGIFE